MKIGARFVFWMLVAGLAAWGGSWLRPRLRQAVVLRESLTATSVDDDVLRDGGAISATTIERFWNTQRIPHRRAVWAALAGRTEPEIAALRARLLPDAARDPDYEVRIRALGTLNSLAAPESIEAVTAQMTDPDPELRRLGLQHLRRRGVWPASRWFSPR